MPIPKHLAYWLGVSQALEITRKRFHKGRETIETVYGITSLSSDQATPERLMNLWRDHWKIENNLHRMRDMAFDEDHSTIRKGSAPQIMAALRNTAIQLMNKINLPMAIVTHLGARFPKQIIKKLQEN